MGFGAPLLVSWLILAVTVTLGPLNFQTTAPSRDFLVITHASGQSSAIHLLLNMLLFVPLGALVHHHQRQSLKLLTIITLVGSVAFLISLTIEFVQRFLPGRESSLIDLAANTVGALAGVYIGSAWGGPVAARIDEMRAWRSPAILAGSLALFMTATLLISAALQAQTGLNNWSRDYPLLIGNERTGDRPWRGRVFELVMTDATTPLVDARRFAAGAWVELAGSVIGAFDLSGAAPYRDAAGNLPELNWTHLAARVDDGRARGPWLQSNQPASHIAERIQATNAFTLRLRCASEDTNQQGPARIVSNSADPSVRNFMLGQNGSDLVIRLRTPVTGLNGSPLETAVRDVFTTEQPRDILVAYDGATLVVAVAPTNQIVRTQLTPGLGAAVALAPKGLDLSHQQIYEVSYLVALFLGPGVLIFVFARSSRDRVVFSVSYILIACVAMETTLMLASGRAFDWVNASLTAAVAAVVLTLTGGTIPMARHP